MKMGSLNPENNSQQDLNDSGCVQDASLNENGYKGYAQLLDLSDDVLLCILQYCTPRDLKALGHTCPRLGALICDRTLWTKVDARNSPIGQLRMKWLLTHCLSPSTTELKIAGYANKYSRCLGIQDLHWPVQADQEFIRGTCIGAAEGMDVEHFLLRMWYPHLPRFAVSPRWPDKAEAESKKAKAAEAAASKSAEPSDFKDGGCSGQNSECLARSFWEHQNSGQNSGNSGCNSGNSGSNSGRSGSCSGNSGSDSGNSGTDSGNSKNKKVCCKCGGVKEESDPKEGKEEPILFEDDIWDDCKGPQFSLTTRLMKDLRRQCSKLTSLALEYCNLDYKTTNLRHFPLHLKKLSLRGSRCYNLPLNTSYLGKVQERLPELEYLDVSECDWLEPASLMPLSKLRALSELYMRDCKRLTECVAYASLATRYGFRRLRVFDVRGSPLADSEVSALGWLPCLEELYISPPDELNIMTEHTHSWSDTTAEFTELDSWETEEPEYYKVKSPEPDEDDDKDDETEGDKPAEAPAQQNNSFWSAHERRIIVIQPNANRQPEERYPLEEAQARRQAQQGPAGDPRPGPAGEPRPGPVAGCPGTARGPCQGPAGRRHDPGLGLADFIMGPVAPEEYPAEEDLPADPRLRPMRSVHGSIDVSPYAIALQLAQFAAQDRPLSPRPQGPANPRPIPADPREDTPNRNAIGRQCPQSRQIPANNEGPAERGVKRPGPSEGPATQQGPSEPRQSRPGPSNARVCPFYQNLANSQGASNPQGGPGGSNVQGQQGPSQPQQSRPKCSFYQNLDNSQQGASNPQGGPGGSNVQGHPSPSQPQQSRPKCSFYQNLDNSQQETSNSQGGPGGSNVQGQPGPSQPQQSRPKCSFYQNLDNQQGASNPQGGQGCSNIQGQQGPTQPQQSRPKCSFYQNLDNSQQETSNSQGGPGCSNIQGQSGPSQPQQSRPKCSFYQNFDNQQGASNAQGGPGCSNNQGQPGPSQQQNRPGPSNARTCSFYQNLAKYQQAANSQGGCSHLQGQAGPSNPEGPNQEPGTSKRRVNGDPTDQAKRRRVQYLDLEDDEIPVSAIRMCIPNPDLCPRLGSREFDGIPRPRIHFRRDELHPIMHIDVDLHRQNLNTANVVGYNLVSDSALLRFGRAENENVNYVHIGRNGIHHGSESGSRPDRSNLRILSVTGYRNITDRSLEHLATAAPYLLHVDFTETSVTPRGVEMFKAVRPDCDVIFSEFSKTT